MDNGRIRPIKVTVVGDGMVGKTCLLITYTSKQFPPVYVPTVFDNYADIITVDDKQYNLTLWDTAGQEDYERLRPLSYPNTNCFIICYSISSRASFDNILLKWFPEIKHFSPTVPIILVATKKDLRDASTSETFVSTVEGKKLRKKIKAAKFLECSALNSEGLEEIFHEAIRTVVSKEQPKLTRQCTVL